MADFEGDKGCGPTHYACECFQRQLQQAQENLRWAREQAESDSRKLQQAQKDAAEQRALAEVCAQAIWEAVHWDNNNEEMTMGLPRWIHDQLSDASKACHEARKAPAEAQEEGD